MTEVLFFEKPGCVNNTRQKAILQALGHSVIARNLLQEPWHFASLRPYFGDRPVSQWFNPSAPRVKSGEVQPELLSEPEALAHMLVDPLLIRRPLIRTPLGHSVGFEAGDPVLAALGVTAGGTDLEGCPREHDPCSAA